jgi:hypothetical protein
MFYSVADDLCSDRGLQITMGYLLPVVAANATITYGAIADRLRVDLSLFEARSSPRRSDWSLVPSWIEFLSMIGQLR